MKRKLYYTTILLFMLGLLCFQQLHAGTTATDVGISTEVSKKKKSTRPTRYKATLNELTIGVVLYVCQQYSWKYDLNQHIITAFVAVCIVGWFLADYVRDYPTVCRWDWKKVVGVLVPAFASAIAFSFVLVQLEEKKPQEIFIVITLGSIGMMCKTLASLTGYVLYPSDGQVVSQLFTEALSVGTLLFSLWQKKTDEDVAVKRTVAFIAFTVLGLIHNLKALPKASLEKPTQNDGDVFSYLWNIRHAFFRHLYWAYPGIWMFMAGERSARALCFALLLCIATNRAYQRIKVTRPATHYLPRITAKYCLGNMILDGIMGVALPYFCLSGKTVVFERLCFSVCTHVYLGWVIDLHTNAIATWCAPHQYAPVIISLLRMCLLAPTTYHIFEKPLLNLAGYLALLYFYGFIREVPNILTWAWEKAYHLLHFKQLFAHQVSINIAAVCTSLLVGMIHIKHNNIAHPLLVLPSIGFLALLLSSWNAAQTSSYLKPFFGHALIVALLAAVEKNHRIYVPLLQLMVPYLMLYWLIDHVSSKVLRDTQRARTLYCGGFIAASVTLANVFVTGLVDRRGDTLQGTLARFLLNLALGIMIVLVVDVLINGLLTIKCLQNRFGVTYDIIVLVIKVIATFMLHILVSKSLLSPIMIYNVKIKSNRFICGHNLVLLLLSWVILFKYFFLAFDLETSWLQKVSHNISQFGYSNLIGCCMVMGLFLVCKQEKGAIKACTLMAPFLTTVVPYVVFCFLIRKVVGDGSVVYELQPNSFMIYEKIPAIKQTHECNVGVLWVALSLVCGLLWYKRNNYVWFRQPL